MTLVNMSGDTFETKGKSPKKVQLVVVREGKVAMKVGTDWNASVCL